MNVGLNALRIFRAREASIDMRERYPFAYRHNIDESCHFNPNINYLYFSDNPSNPDTPTPTSPFYCFTLIPETTVEGKVSLNETLYFMQFLNWSIYYYNTIKEIYKTIPKDPNQRELLESSDTVKSMENFMTSLTNKEYTDEQTHQHEQDTFKKNHFILKPTYFLKLCRFFARAWYEEHFSSPDDAVGSVAFGYYITNYIEHDLGKCTYYNGNSNYHKKEVIKLFEEDRNLSYQFNDFHISLEQHLSPEGDTPEKFSYSMSISQFGCKHSFYLYARLYHHRYTSNFIG